jgi:hypothetical protein
MSEEVQFVESQGENTLISYMYRDAGNYKQFRDVVAAGRITREQFDRFVENLDEGFRFVPGQVGLPDLQGMFDDGWDDDLDHPYHELLTITFTSAAADVAPTAEELAEALATTAWDPVYLPR